jgi:hypothetical protein
VSHAVMLVAARLAVACTSCRKAGRRAGCGAHEPVSSLSRRRGRRRRRQRRSKGRAVKFGSQILVLPQVIPSTSPARGVTSAGLGPVCVRARRRGRMAVLKLTDQVGAAEPASRQAGRTWGGAEPAWGWRCVPERARSCLLAATGRRA